MLIEDLGLLSYRDAWAVQERAHAEVSGGGEERLLLVEHPPVITFGRRPDVARHLIASDEQLARMGVEVVQSDRGGDITFHGPGQLVAYPIVRLADHRLMVGSYVRTLLEIVIATLGEFGIVGQCDPNAPGVWVDERQEGDTSVAPAGARAGMEAAGGNPRNSCGKSSDTERLAKICAVGVRIRRGASMHGIALNVTTDLDFFHLIVPCGLPNRSVTSMRRILGDATPCMNVVKRALATHLLAAFAVKSVASSAQ